MLPAPCIQKPPKENKDTRNENEGPFGKLRSPRDAEVLVWVSNC